MTYSISKNKRIVQISDVFHRFGMWRTDNKNAHTHLDNAKKLLYLISYITFPLSLAVGGYLSDDENEAIYLVAAAIPQAVGTVKLAYILWKQEEICAFLDDVSTHSITDYNEFIQINNKLTNLIKFSTCFIVAIVVGCATVIAFSLPAFTSNRRLPVNIAFPLDWKNNLIAYWLAYALFTIATALSMVIISFNIVIWYLMLNLSVKYQILGYELRNMGADSSETVTPKERLQMPKIPKENIFLRKFVGIIGTYKNIRGRIDRFKSLFATLYFTQITTSGITICGAVFSLAFATHNDLFQTVVNCMLLIYNIFDIFMVMYLGNEIKIFSDRLSYLLFESNWIDQSLFSKRCIIIFSEVVRRPQQLVIGKLYPMDLKTFTSILNLAYSMFNILQNIK